MSDSSTICKANKQQQVDRIWSKVWVNIAPIVVLLNVNSWLLGREFERHGALDGWLIASSCCCFASLLALIKVCRSELRALDRS